MKINLPMMNPMRNKFKMVLTSNFIDVKIIFLLKIPIKTFFNKKRLKELLFNNIN